MPLCTRAMGLLLSWVGSIPGRLHSRSPAVFKMPGQDGVVLRVVGL